MFSFTEEKQQQAPFRSIAGEGRSREALGVVSSENRKLRLALGFPSNTLTHTRRERERETVLLGSKNSEARHTRRVFESGMKHVCSIYMMEFYVFLCKHEAKAVREEKRHPPRCLLHYVCGSTILYVV